ncbi:MAG TPA: outer membrane protein assembly factor BamE [Hyphomicrobiaceae bacterium]|nr:outer membrane protein assembly factor BamE [Hyphomicrobiaceae bacterium]
MMRLAMDARKLNDATVAEGQAKPAQALRLVQRQARLTVLLSLGLGLGLALLGCSETIIKHGHQFQENDLQSITSGMSQEQVRTTLGTPTTTATVGGGSAYYYISSTTGQTAFFKEVEKDRKVLAVYFNQLGSVDRVAHYGIKDGKVFNFAKQKTSTPSRDEGIIKALFRNLGAKQFGTGD